MHLPGTNTSGAITSVMDVPIDIRSMRRLREGYRLVMVVVKDDSIQDAVMNLAMRILWKLQA